jgi:hypothetical protein
MLRIFVLFCFFYDQVKSSFGVFMSYEDKVVHLIPTEYNLPRLLAEIPRPPTLQGDFMRLEFSWIKRRFG